MNTPPPVPPDMPEIPGIPSLPINTPPPVPEQGPATPAVPQPMPPAMPSYPAAAAPVQPPYYPPVAQKQGMGGGTKALLFGCLGLVLLALIALVSFGIWAGKKGKALLENPGQFMAELVVAQNPDLEIVSVDNSAKKVVLRSKKSGESATFAFEDLDGGKLTIETPDGTKTEMDSSGIKVKDKTGKMKGITPDAVVVPPIPTEETTGEIPELIPEETPEEPVGESPEK